MICVPYGRPRVAFLTLRRIIAARCAYHAACVRSTTALVGGSGRLAGLPWEVAVAPVAQCSSSRYAGSCWFSDVDDDGHAAAFLCLR